VKALRLALLASVVPCALQGPIVAAAVASGNVVVAGAVAAPAPSDVADAVMRRDGARLRALLKAHSDVNAPQPDGSTALHWAAYEGDAHLAAALLAAGAHPNVVTDTKMTPLLLACEAGNADLVEELLRAGADPNQALGGGETPLMMAARTGSVPVLKLLLARGANMDAREMKRGTNALMSAAANGT